MEGHVELFQRRTNGRGGEAYVLFEGAEASRDCWRFLKDFPTKILTDTHERIIEIVEQVFPDNPVLVGGLDVARTGSIAKVLQNHLETGVREILSVSDATGSRRVVGSANFVSESLVRVMAFCG